MPPALVTLLLRMAGVGLLSSIALPVYAMIKWRGWWKIAAFLPLIAIFLMVAMFLPSWSRDPNAGSFWAMYLVPLEACSFLYAVALVIVYEALRPR